MKHPEPIPDQEEKQDRARRPRPLSGALLKLSKEATRLSNMASTDETRTEKDDARVRAICNTATGGGMEKILRSSPSLSEDDRAFLREKGWRV